MPRTARSRSADGVTTAALLPPSSRIVRPNRAATRGATAAPIRSEPVALTSGTRRSSSSGAAPSASVTTTVFSPSGAPTSRAARSSNAAAATATSGVLSDGFHTTVLPQTSAIAAFHAHTAAGKLKAEMTATTPSGCQVSISRWPGRSDGIVRPSSWRESPTARSHTSIISWTSPRDSETILPTSTPMRSASSCLCSVSSSPNRLTSRPRTGAGTDRHARNASWARATAASTSAADAKGTVATGSPVTGLTHVDASGAGQGVGVGAAAPQCVGRDPAQLRGPRRVQGCGHDGSSEGVIGTPSVPAASRSDAAASAA